MTATIEARFGSRRFIFQRHRLLGLSAAIVLPSRAAPRLPGVRGRNTGNVDRSDASSGQRGEPLSPSLIERATKGLMPDGASRFSYKGETIFHYMSYGEG